MADQKVSQLPAVTTPAGTDELPTNQSGVSRKITLAQIQAFIESLVAIGLANGGTGSDLSATGPGFLQQASAGAALTVDPIAAGDLPTGIDAANIGAGSVSNTEFGYLDGVTSAIQTQLDARAALAHKNTHVDGGADEFVDGDLLNAIARLIVKVDGSTIQAIGRRGLNLRAQSGSGLTITATDSSPDEHTDILLNLTGIDAARIGAGAVDNTEFGYLNGVTSAIQTQIAGKADLAHKSRHVAGGADEFADGDLLKAVARVIVKSAGSTVYANGRRALNFRAGSGISITISDSSADEHTDILLGLTGGGGGGALTHIDTITLSSDGYFDWTGIPSSYTHLVLIGRLRGADALSEDDVVGLQFNGDDGTNYTNSSFVEDSPTVASNTEASATSLNAALCPDGGAIANAFVSVFIVIPNYRASMHKSIVPSNSFAHTDSSTDVGMAIMGGVWLSTAAINQITVLAVAGTNFSSGSSLSLYGI